MSVFLKIMKNGGAYLLLWWCVWRCCLLVVVVVVTIWLLFNRFGLMMSFPYYGYYHDQENPSKRFLQSRFARPQCDSMA